MTCPPLPVLSDAGNKHAPWLLSVAPMMGWTDRHDRYFLRLLSPNIRLYTVMLTTGALLHGKANDFLEYDPSEHPLAIQLGGSDPDDMARCAKIAQDYGYDEVNINCGCPSDRVKQGQFGACLMAAPGLVADCVDAMRQKVDIPVTVKTRIGIDEQDDYGFLRDFVGTIAGKGCSVFIIHARKAWLNGLSPAENRSIPPLKWETVHRLKQDFPELTIILNGGVKSVTEVNDNLAKIDGIMIGREAYQNPSFLLDLERAVFQNQNLKTRHEAIDALIPYADRMLTEGHKLHDITRHILGLFQGQRGARRWRQILSGAEVRDAKNSDAIRVALREIKV